MDGVIKAKPSLYCPISVSEMVTNNAKLRQNSLRDYSHAKDAAYRALCRAPGRPQTAAFGRVYYETRLNYHQSLSPSETKLRECVVASKATPVEEGTYTTLDNNKPGRRPIYAERRLLSRAKTVQRTLLRQSPERLCKEKADTVNGLEVCDAKEVCVEDKAETSDILIDLDSVSDKTRSDTEHSSELSGMLMLPSEDSMSTEMTERQLTVYHFVEITAHVSDRCDAFAYDACGSHQRFVVSSYSVEIQGEGYQSTPGLGHCDSQENRALWDLVEKQISLSGRQNKSDDKCREQHLESLDMMISQLVNVTPPNGYRYYFAYGPDMNATWLMTHDVHCNIDDTSCMALLYGFKLASSSSDSEDAELRSVWPECKYRPQSAVEGRVYLISQQEAEELDVKQGLVTVVLPVWLTDSDDSGCSTAQHCLPALVRLLPTALVD